MTAVHTDFTPAHWGPTMPVALKIWRFDSASGERKLERYDVEAPEWATLLDMLDTSRTGSTGRSRTARAAA